MRPGAVGRSPVCTPAEAGSAWRAKSRRDADAGQKTGPQWPPRESAPRTAESERGAARVPAPPGATHPLKETGWVRHLRPGAERPASSQVILHCLAGQ